MTYILDANSVTIVCDICNESSESSLFGRVLGMKCLNAKSSHERLSSIKIIATICMNLSYTMDFN